MLALLVVLLLVLLLTSVVIMWLLWSLIAYASAKKRGHFFDRVGTRQFFIGKDFLQ